MCARESFGVPEVIAAADVVECRCGGTCPLPSVADIVRWQADPDD